jgi:hypothetical protein
MVSVPKKNYSPLLAWKLRNRITHFIESCHNPNEYYYGWKPEWLQALGALCSLRFTKKPPMEISKEMHWLINQEKVKRIENYEDREITVASM